MPPADRLDMRDIISLEICLTSSAALKTFTASGVKPTEN